MPHMLRKSCRRSGEKQGFSLSDQLLIPETYTTLSKNWTQTIFIYSKFPLGWLADKNDLVCLQILKNTGDLYIQPDT